MMADTDKKLHKHFFLSEIACEIGLIPALLLEYVTFWVSSNERNNVEQVYKDGKYWTYGSIAQIQKKLPYLTNKQIRTGMDKLIELRIVEIGNYNKKAYDKTKWYTPTAKAYRMMEGTLTDDPELYFSESGEARVF